MKEILDSNIPWIFQSLRTYFYIIIKKQKNPKNSAHLCLQTCFSCHYGILKSNDLVLGMIPEIFLTWFLLVFVLKKIETQLLIK